MVLITKAQSLFKPYSSMTCDEQLARIPTPKSREKLLELWFCLYCCLRCQSLIRPGRIHSRTSTFLVRVNGKLYLRDLLHPIRRKAVSRFLKYHEDTATAKALNALKEQVLTELECSRQKTLRGITGTQWSLGPMTTPSLVRPESPSLRASPLYLELQGRAGQDNADTGSFSVLSEMNFITKSSWYFKQ